MTQQYFSQLDRTEYDTKLMTNVRSYIQPGAEFRPLESYGAHVVLMSTYRCDLYFVGMHAINSS